MRVIGVAMAYIKGVDIVTNDTNIEAGVVEAGGVVTALTEDGVKQANPTAIITYKRQRIRDAQGSDVHISSFPNLKEFARVAVEHIYAQGMSV